MSCEIRVLGAGDEGLLSNATPASSTIRSFRLWRGNSWPIPGTTSRWPSSTAGSWALPRQFTTSTRISPAELWINEVGLALAFRRRGLGRHLLQTLFRVGTALGCSEAWVLTDRANLGAQALYASVGGTQGVGGSGGDNPIIGYSFPLGAGR